MENFFIWNLMGISRMVKKLYGEFLRKYNRQNIWERVFLWMPFLLWFLLMQPWRGFHVNVRDFSDYHGLYTNDLLILFFFIGVLFASGVYRLMVENSDKKMNQIQMGIRVLFSGLIFLFFILNLIFPSRVAPTQDATFTVWFFFFGGFTIVTLLCAVLGIKTIPRTGAWLQ